MEALNKHQLKTEATKRKLLKSALRVFTRDGVEAARIDDIASEAGFTRGAFYAHFKTKEELFLALLEQQLETKTTQLRDLLLEQEDDAGRLDALRNFYADQLSDDAWPILRLEFKLYGIRHGKKRKTLAEAHRQAYRRVRNSEKFGLLKNLVPSRLEGDPNQKEQARLALECLLSGMAVQRAYDPESLALKDAKEVLRRCFDGLIAGEFKGAHVGK